MASQQSIARGFYQHTQPNNFVSVKNYIFTRQDNKKCLLLRFSNDLGYNVDDMRFTLYQIDAVGKVIKNTTVTYKDMKLSSGGVFVPSNALVVDEFCTDFKVSVHEVRSGQYMYAVRDGVVSVKYIKDESDLELNGPKGEAIVRTSAAPDKFGKEGWATALSVIGVLLMLAMTALGLLQSIGII